ncbi:MAG: mechanosensitive ion channel family protein [Varibaculum cambriense]
MRLQPLDTSSSDETVEQVFDWLTSLAGMGVGVLAGFILALITVAILKLLAKREPLTQLVLNRATRSLLVTLMILGAYLGWKYTTSGLEISRSTGIGRFSQGLLIAVILAFTFLITRICYFIEDVAVNANREKPSRSRSKMLTQAQVIRRLLQAVVVVVGISSAILTFPSAQVAMSSMLASAGVASIVATLAAQSTLANVFAGVQMALSDALRVGDKVQVPGLDGTKELGTVEEITLTYVVLNLYDERRMIVPSTHFTQQKFENWTRKHSQQLGIVELQLDYSAPIDSIRAQVDLLLSGTELWDGRSASVEVSDMTADCQTVRISVSAADSSDLWVLRCYLREQLIQWLVKEVPWALVSRRIQPQQVRYLNRDRSEEEVHRLARKLVGETDLQKG